MSLDSGFFSPSNKNSLITTEITGTPPAYRINSSSCLVHQLNLFFVFGGYDEDDIIDDNIYILDIKNNKWLSSKTTGIFRDGHSCVAMPDGKVLIIGGLPKDEISNERKNVFFQDCFLLIYDIKSDSFSIPFQQQSSDTPGFLFRQAACLSTDKTKVFISGGVIGSIPEGMHDELYSFEFKTGKWEKMNFVKKLEHAIMEFDNKIWLFGGISEQMSINLQQISTYDLSKGSTTTLFIDDIPNNSSSLTYFQKVSDTQALILMTLPTENSTIGYLSKVGIFDTKKLSYHEYMINISHEFRWRVFFEYDDMLCLLGSEFENSEFPINYIMKIPIHMLGINRNLEPHVQTNLILNDFYQMYQNEEFVDFKIYALDDKKSSNSNNGISVRSEAIKVHKVFLMTRWPYFKKLYHSGMVESQLDEMFIEEPVKSVEKLIEFFYSNRLHGCSVSESIELLPLVELYQVFDLKSLIMNNIYEMGFKTGYIIDLWKISLKINDEILRLNTENFIFENWGKVIKMKTFQNLDKDLILKLFETLNDDSHIVMSDKKQGFVKRQCRRNSETLPQSTDNYQSREATPFILPLSPYTISGTTNEFDVLQSPDINGVPIQRDNSNDIY